MVSRRFKRYLRTSQTGQSIVILALGMVGLLAIVGIAVDVSILFVRFNTLRRAVDSASIAAAGQMRDDRNIGEVGMAARQFVEFHNLNPRDVLVETCHTAQTIDLDPDTPEVEVDEDLCTADQRKLVRVTAEIESPTVFLRLVGIGAITLRASATSETAVLDVVLVMDVSESMLHDTTYQDWADVNQGYAYVPPRAWSFGNFGGDPATGTNDPDTIFGRELIAGDYDPATFIDDFYDVFWQQDLLGVTQESVNRRLQYNVGDDTADADPSYRVESFIPAGTPAGQVHPRSECRVRFHPYSQGIPVPEYIEDLYTANGRSLGTDVWGNFVPSYSFYGCCNDPGNGQQDPNNINEIIGVTSVLADNNFSDLVCEPFRSARDATRLFLERIDFVRGDRVGFVTFDRTAFIVDPDGDQVGLTHMIEDAATATDTLDRMIGVRAEPNFYDWDEANGGWIGFAQGIDNNGQSIPINYYSTGPEALNYNDYPVIDNCPFQNAAMKYPFSRYATRGQPGNVPNGDPVDGSETLYNIMTPNILADPWRGPASVNNMNILNSYELWASCRGTNIGAALREGNNALTDPSTSRSEGTVWVMIMLSDGAAGASDPARRFAQVADVAAPYQIQPGFVQGDTQRYGVPGQYGAFGVCPYGTPTAFAELTDTGTENPIEFPFCLDERPETRHFCYPASGVATDAFQHTVGATIPGGGSRYEAGFGPGAPDINYNTGDSYELNGQNGRVYDIDVGDYPLNTGNCDIYYDVDDYARDWADFVGRVWEEAGGNVTLPTIFTIGFGLNFDNGRSGDTPGTCDENVSDCLGEELLRYIADVGDNFSIDTNYQQFYLQEAGLVPFDAGDTIPERLGAPSICEPPDVAAGYLGGFNTADPDNPTFLPPTESCGNYFNAPDEQELQIVFDEIASRMFTRLAG